MARRRPRSCPLASVRAVRVVLASASPRRRALLEGVGLAVQVVPADVDETPVPGESPREMVARLARAKAAAVGPRAGAVVVAADTTVDLDGAIIGKPRDAEDACDILGRLSGRTHVVHTGVAIMGGGPADEVFVVSTRVTFVPLTTEAIAWYAATGEPLDAAGAYAIQGRGGAFVAAVEGSFSNVVGLPLAETLAALRRAGLAVPAAVGHGPAWPPPEGTGASPSR